VTDLICLSPALTREAVASCGAKALAVFDLYRIVFEERNLAVIDRFVAADYKSYTAVRETSRAALKDYFSERLDQFESTTIETHFAVEQAECAMVLHSFHIRLKDGTEDLVRTADCFRFRGDLIAEHWDAVMIGLPGSDI
jgi:predicted SnoaL-like aldol condensation-catalyzing enzyme